ncbi:MAG: mechanosensitive ion channel domain-containing protein, partial [Microcystaceae cyanobacterium]
YHLLFKLGMHESDREVLATLISYAIAAFGFIIVIEISGFNLASVAIIGGGLGVGIGFGLQDIAKNLLSGLTILMERKLKVGDYIETEDISGYIQEISIRSTIVRTLEGGDIVIPNNDLTANKVLNWNYGSYTGCIRIPIGVAYDSDPILVTEVLLNSAYTHRTVLHEPPPKVVFIGFGENSLDFELWVWVNRVDQSIFIKSHLNFAIEYHFRRQGIVIPFPQREVRLHQSPTLNSTSFEKVNTTKGSPDLPELEQQPSLEPSYLALKDLLKQLPYFKGYSELKICQLIELGYRKHLTAEEILWREGDACHTFYLLLVGSLRVAISTKENSITVLHAGDFVGAVALMFKNSSLYSTVQALEETVLFAIPKLNFDKLLQNHPDFAEVIIQRANQKHEFLLEYKQHLQALGLLNSVEEKLNPIVWLRHQMNKLFGSSE